MAGPTTDITIDIRSRFFGKAFTEAQVATKNLNKHIRDMNREIRQTRRDALIMGTGMLFAGMGLQRTFSGILKAGNDTFRQITEATWGTSTALTGLAAAGNFLAFTMGDALNTILEPLMPTIIALVNTIADFVQQHPEVVWLAIAAAVTGMAMVAYGSVKDFLAILMHTMSGTVGAEIVGNAGATSGFLSKIAGLSFVESIGGLSGLATVLIGIAAAVGIGALLVKVLIDNVKTFTGITDDIQKDANAMTITMKKQGLVNQPINQGALGFGTGPLGSPNGSTGTGMYIPSFLQNQPLGGHEGGGMNAPLIPGLNGPELNNTLPQLTTQAGDLVTTLNGLPVYDASKGDSFEKFLTNLHNTSSTMGDLTGAVTTVNPLLDTMNTTLSTKLNKEFPILRDNILGVTKRLTEESLDDSLIIVNKLFDNQIISIQKLNIELDNYIKRIQQASVAANSFGGFGGSMGLRSSVSNYVVPHVR